MPFIHWLKSVPLFCDVSLVVSFIDGTLQIANFKSSYGHEFQVDWKTLENEKQQVDAITAASSHFVTAARYEPYLRVWDTSAILTKPVITLKGHMKSVSCLDSLSNEIIVSCSSDRSIRLWSINTGKCIMLLTHTDSVKCVISLTSTTIVSGSNNDGLLCVWDITNGVCVKKMKSNSGLRCLEKLSSNTFISGSDDFTIRLWCVDAGVCDKIFTGHQGSILSIKKLTSDLFCSCSSDRTLGVWSVRSGLRIRTLDGHAQTVSCVERLPVALSFQKFVQNIILECDNFPHVIADEICQYLFSDLLISASVDSIRIWDMSGQCVGRIKTNWPATKITMA